MKYLKKYSTDAEYQADTKSIPQVSWVDETEKVEYEFPVPPVHDYSQDYLTFVSESDNNAIAWKRTTDDTYFEPTIYYSTDDGATWRGVYAAAYGETIATLQSGEKVMVKSNYGGYNSLSGACFTSTGNFHLEGNIMSMAAGDDFATATTVSANAFQNLFTNATGLTSAQNLVLPATTLESRCYESMFSNCRSLTTAPELPATTLAMYSYYLMFGGCTSLNSITCLATDISADGCLTLWLYGVASTGTFTKASSMTGWTTGVNGIPTGWTVEDYQ